MTILIFILIICSIIMMHELGHFLLAKANGITVKEFFVGMGPTLCSVTKGGTKYSLKLLPIGGACVFEGEDGREEDDGAGEKIPLSEGAFPNASAWARIATVAAGPIFNFILAYLLAVVITATTYSDKPVIQNVIEGFAAQEAGIQAGDLITRIDGERVYLSREISLITTQKQGKPLNVEYMRDGEKHETLLMPKLDQESGRYLLGFQGYAEYFKCSPTQVFQYSYYEVRYGLKATLKSLQMLVSGKASKDEISGPVGIAVLVDDVAEQAKPYGIWVVAVSMFKLAMLLSVNLGVLNLLPLPALDGGRLVFLLLEVVRGKPIPPEKEGMVHLVGFAVLLVLMALIMYNDIVKLL